MITKVFQQRAKTAWYNVCQTEPWFHNELVFFNVPCEEWSIVGKDSLAISTQVTNHLPLVHYDPTLVTDTVIFKPEIQLNFLFFEIFKDMFYNFEVKKN